jgi:hypothetical protein
MDDFWAGAEIISRYSRAQAIDDGVLVDVSEQARESGFTVPFAMTRTVWHLVDPTQAEIADWGQSVAGRLHDVLWMAHLAIKASTGGTELIYEVIFQMRDRSEFRSGQRKVALKLHSGPGDEGEHVMTLMLPEED